MRERRRLAEFKSNSNISLHVDVSASNADSWDSGCIALQNLGALQWLDLVKMTGSSQKPAGGVSGTQ